MPVLGGSSRTIVLKCRDEGLLGQCGSGGAFTLLAKAVVRRGGVVFGAAYRPDWTVEHIAVEREDDLPWISGTKYLQSEMCGYPEYARESLKRGPQPSPSSSNDTMPVYLTHNLFLKTFNFLHIASTGSYPRQTLLFIASFAVGWLAMKLLERMEELCFKARHA